MALVTDAIAVALIAVAIAGAFWRTLGQAWKGDAEGRQAGEGARLRLARSLALGLEFLLAADIMRTAVAPTWTEIGQLAAIAALRTALNIFLQREIEGVDRAAGRRPAPGSCSPPAP
ncbi:MAG: DUF1622 domain-containing protein [Phenylobacterium sp.]|nr:MAG: DUF1622 domain-containing protein [Phenylobacterium sp.]